MKKILNISIVLLSILFVNLVVFSCQKDNSVAHENAILSPNSTRNADHEQVILEPDYNQNGNALLEYLRYHQLTYNYENLVFSDSLAQLVRDQIDSVFNQMGNFSTTSEMVNYLVSSGVISQSFENAYSSVMQSIDNGDSFESILAALENDFSEVNNNSDLNNIEKVQIKSIITYLKSYFIYMNEGTSYSDSLSQNKIGFREKEDCIFNSDDILEIGKEASKYAALGALIGNVIPALGTSVGAAAGAGVGLVIGIGKAVYTDNFCRECIMKTFGRKLTGLCDNKAYFAGTAGSSLVYFEWKRPLINGKAEKRYTQSGEWNLVEQFDPVPPVTMLIYSNCDKGGKIVTVDVPAIKISNIIQDQVLVPEGSLSIVGPTSIDEFTAPSTPNWSDYNEEVTKVYDLSGLVYERPELEISGFGPFAANVENMSINGKKLTVTWKVDQDHWNEFYNDTQTIGSLSIKVHNTCAGGEERHFFLYAALIYYDDHH